MSYTIELTKPSCVMMSSDYSQQEPKILAFVSGDPAMIKAFQEGKDIYATIAALAFKMPYEKCLEFHPETHEYQADGKARRTEAKSVVLGITYGRSTKTIGEQLFPDLPEDQQAARAQEVYDAVLNAFPGLRDFMLSSQARCSKLGYTETILGRRRHIPDMMLPEFEFKAMRGYVNPDIDPLDLSTLDKSDDIPERIVNDLKKEFSKFKYYGQIVKRTKELYEDKIKVINNRQKITEASRKVVNCVDTDTEILTLDGWKRYNEVSSGDAILSYSMNTHTIEHDKIEGVHIYPGSHEVIHFKSPTFDAVSTLDHRWVCNEGKAGIKFRTTEFINRHRWPDSPIIRVANNLFEENKSISDNELKLYGWFLTDGHCDSLVYGIHLYQSTKRAKNRSVYEDMIHTLDALSIPYSDRCRDGVYHEIYLRKCPTTLKMLKNLPGRKLNVTFINTLSQAQSSILIKSMHDGDGSGRFNTKDTISVVFSSEEQAKLFQILCFRAGRASSTHETSAETANKYTRNKKYGSLSNKEPIHCNQSYYEVSVYKIKLAQLYAYHKSSCEVDTVWCVTTNNHTWIARRNGFVYVTGNSQIQGSAAELTKMAILNLENNERWAQIGGKFKIPVHDELIAEVPLHHKDEGEEILRQAMESAGSFLPFTISCDVTTTTRWYGLECLFGQHKKPTDIDTQDPDEVMWIQSHLFDQEYTLPVYKEADGSKPRGDAAMGINGKLSVEYESAIQDYIKKNGITEDTFIDHIDRRCLYRDNY